MQQSHRIIYNAFTNYGRVIVKGLLAFLLVPYIIHRIGEDSYGLVLLAMSALGMVELFGVGLGKAVTKHIAEHKARGDQSLLNIVFNSSLLWFFVVGAVGSSVIYLVGLNFASIFTKIPDQLVRDGQLAMYIIALVICPSLTADVFKGVLAGDQRYDLVNFVGVARAALRAALVVGYFSLIGPSLTAVVVIYAGSHLLERVGYLIASYRAFPVLKISRAFIKRRGMGMVMGFASMVLMASIANILAYEIMKWVIGRELSPAHVTRYGIIAMLIMFSNELVRSFVNVLVPVASKYQGLDNYDVIRKLFLHGTKYAVILVLCTAGVTMPYLPALLRLWMGPGFVHLWSLGAVMFGAQILIISTICATQILSGLGKVRFIGIVSLVWGACSLGAGWLYLHFWPGAVLLGVVLCMSVARIAGASAILARGVRIIGVRWRELLLGSIFKPIAVGAAVAGLALGLTQLITIESWFVLVPLVMLTELVFLGAATLWCLNEEDKQRAKSLILKVVERFTRRHTVGS